MTMLSVDDTLATWADLNDIPWTGLLVGNGASSAIWDGFKYTSLFQEACSAALAHGLNGAAVAIFDKLQTRNFELVLSGLQTTSLIVEAMGQDPGPVNDLYSSTQTALVEAVKSVHVPWANIPEASLRAIKAELLRFNFVYSTNYDLIIYWAVMIDGPTGFTDYFFGPRFDLSNTEIWGKATKLMFLHGALHLYRELSGQTLKRKAEEWQNLLDLFGVELAPPAVPLFVTEGSSKDKLSSINRSDYLSFCYSQFARHRGPLVVFGHSLTPDFDGHLIDAIRKSDAAVLAISMLPGAQVPANKAKMYAAFPNMDLHFFDATTHPLGAVALHIPQNAN
jgi:Domain of unknown function (DUF4917)